MLNHSPLFLLFSILILLGCTQNKSDATSTGETALSFEDLKGITFHEVRRQFNDGLSFNEIGFQQEPEWTLAFQANDSVDVFSPTMNKMVGFYLHHDHANYYNFAKEWFGVKLLAKDSIVLQRLEVQSLKIKNDVRSNVFMTFYADSYIKKLNTSINELRKPNSKDSLFVKKRADLANQHPLDSTYMFSARNPVKFTALSKNASVSKRGTNDKQLIQSKSYAYIYPEYDIVINKAYKDFYYAFRAVVETNSKITVYDFPTFDEETIETRKKLLQGILDVYVSNMLKAEPGNTLGFQHASLVTLYIKGSTD